MANVVEVAQARRAKLLEETRKLDDFIRMAQELSGADGQVSAAPSVAPVAAPAQPVQEAGDASGGEAPRPNIFRRVAGD